MDGARLKREAFEVGRLMVFILPMLMLYHIASPSAHGDWGSTPTVPPGGMQAVAKAQQTLSANASATPSASPAASAPLCVPEKLDPTLEEQDGVSEAAKSVALMYDDLDRYVSRTPLTMVYHVKPFHWTWHLDHWLSRVKRPIKMIVDPKATSYHNHAIVVVNHMSTKYVEPYFGKLKAKGFKNIGMFHTGDIEFNVPKTVYQAYNQARFVVRNHFPSKKKFVQRHMPVDKVRVLPLGSLTMDSMNFVNNFNYGRMRPASRRRHLCAFIGSLKNHKARKDLANGLVQSKMIESQKTYKLMGTQGGLHCVSYFSGTWGHKRQMKPYQYRELVSDSVFTFVPPGRGPSSFRLYEALELGSIPVVSDVEHFNLPFGDHPLPRIPIDQWATAPVKLMKMFHEQPELQDDLQRRVFRWWYTWKGKYLDMLSCLVEREIFEEPSAPKCPTAAEFAGTAITQAERSHWEKVVAEDEKRKAAEKAKKAKNKKGSTKGSVPNQPNQPNQPHNRAAARRRRRRRGRAH